ncbi:hypothetical protein DERP_007388 [Dermatophagoides pteronyssinus]|uniref:Protein tweety homolog n=2 Tax=Dermatophagoides pteronyssinus TaxID=6956 RepID=A0A6P6YC53_DERPT|nr:uncharacterized protein LOC113796450 [Dermatophagoides pteronyssinus]KAH9417390.1 hypothetical protein DERP_007388 [Dermatophagoides pteronyssinus]
MYYEHPNGYNISQMAIIFNSIPHIQLTNEGLIPLTNTTFDYGRLSYLNSLLITFIIPLFVLLIIFFIYICYLFIWRYLEYNSRTTKSTTILQKQKFKTQRPCRWLMIICGCFTIGILIFGLTLMYLGFRDTGNTIEEFIQSSNNSKQTLRNWNDYLQNQMKLTLNSSIETSLSSSPESTSLSNNQQQYYLLKRLNETIEFYTNKTKIQRMKWSFQIYQWLTLSIILMNLLNIFLMSAYWLILALFGHYIDNNDDNRLKRFILITFAMVIIQIWMFDSHLVTTIATSDFCLSAKQSIADIVVNKFPEYNYTMSMVRYYLDCDLPKHLNLQDHKNTVDNYLDQWDNLEILKLPVGKILKQNFNFIDSIRKNINETYQIITCEHMNEIINKGLTEFCQQPINGFTLLTFGHFFHFFLTILLLFLITFAY